MGNTSSRVTAQDKAILDLKIQRDKLHQYQRRITVLTDRETEVARQEMALAARAAHANGGASASASANTNANNPHRRRALLALRRKKYQEQLLAKTDAQLAQLEQLTRSVEFAAIQKDVVFGLRQGTRVLQEIHAEMGGLEHVEKLMGDTAEAIAYQQEVSDMLGGRITNQDEDEVEDELAALEAEVNGPTTLPAAPVSALPEIEAQDEERAPARQRQAERRAMLAS